MTDAYDGELVSSFYCRSPDAVTSNDFASIEYLEGWPTCTGDGQEHPSGERATGPFGPLQARPSNHKLGYPIPITKDGSSPSILGDASAAYMFKVLQDNPTVLQLA